MSSYFHSASQSCPILCANCMYNFRFSAAIAQVWINLHRQHVMAVIQWWCERGAKSHVAKEISRGGRRRSRDEKGNRGVGDFRFINILQLFSIYFFFRLLLLYLFVLSILFLPTTFIYSHTHDPHPRPLPTTYDPRHLASNIPLAIACCFLHAFLSRENPPRIRIE